MTEKISIIIAESQYLVSLGLKTLISESAQFKTPETVFSECELTQLLKSQLPEIIIFSPSVFNETENQYLPELRIKYPKIKILILAETLNRLVIQGYNSIGIENIIYKSAEKEEILNAITATLKGKKYYSSEVFDTLLSDEKKQTKSVDFKLLTITEREIVKLISEGLTTKEIACKRGLSFHTIISHRKNIFRKLNINNVSELMVIAIKNGILDDIEYFI